MSENDLPPLPPGFQRVSGKRAPADKDARWFIQLRQGFYSTEVSYTREQLRWVHDGGAGDVVAVRKAAGGD